MKEIVVAVVAVTVVAVVAVTGRNAVVRNKKKLVNQRSRGGRTTALCFY